MLDKDHVLVSEAVCLGIIEVSSTRTYVLTSSLIGTLIGSQLPDIDTTKSKIGHFTRPVSTLISHFGHRGITHSLFGLMAVYILTNFVLNGAWFHPLRNLWGVSWTIFLRWIVIGYLLHLIEDWFSRSGIIWLYPFQWMEPYDKWYPPIKTRNGSYDNQIGDLERREPPVYVRLQLKKWFRYHSTDRGPKGRYERNIRRIAKIILILEIFILAVHK